MSSLNTSQNIATTTQKKNVFFFAKGDTDGSAQMKEVLGGKGANLAEMTNLGIPVPPGFTIATHVCSLFFEAGESLPDFVKAEALSALKKVESIVGKKFGDSKDPLLFSVRSGARASMPGMMDTILNLGLNDETVLGLAQSSGNERFAYDSYRRFIQMYSDVVMGMNGSVLEVQLEDLKADRKVEQDTDLSVADLKSLVKTFKSTVEATTGRRFPTDPFEQLWGAVKAVFQSWNTPRAIAYRGLHAIPASWGTAVNVQAMVFGNRGATSATGVAFSRNPSTGEKKFYGEYLVNAQGEDVVAGIRTPIPVLENEAAKAGFQNQSLEFQMPTVFKELVEIYQKLEAHYRDMQDMEFTVEDGKLWMLQTRTGKRTAQAALKIACDMLDEGLISEEEAILRIEPKSLDQLLHPTLDPKAKKTRLTKALPASPGGATGQIVFSSEDAVEFKERGIKVILCRVETSPEDILGMVASQGILTSRGGMTSHAAVVARGMGKCCVAGAGEVQIDYLKQELRVNGHLLKRGDLITLDGSTGEVYLGEVMMVEPELSGDFSRLMKLADEMRGLGVRANADTPKDAETARAFGAEGIGLCRTEHMFFGADRIDVVREMILAETKEARVSALERLLPMQKSDFLEIFKAMNGFPVTIRLLDPPLHEFLPHTDEEIRELAAKLKAEFSHLKLRVKGLHEFNPMLGHRGCRLAMTYPEIYQMQARAIAEAALEASALGVVVHPEIMIPLIATARELQVLRADVESVVAKVVASAKRKVEGVHFAVGTMIELPRAAIVAGEIAKHADFFSFGTNDLTQTAMGLSRDDSARFLGTYIEAGVLPEDPFVSIDQDGVGFLVEMGTKFGRNTKASLKVGVCGEHGGDPESIRFFHRVGLNYVSCSPYRVPIARLAAAQASVAPDSKKGTSGTA